MKRKVIALFLCIVLVCTFCFPAYADSDDSSSDGYSAIISDIPTTCPTCGAALHASWRSTAGAEVELQITEAGKITIPAGAGVYAHFRLYCENCGYSKSETRILGLDWGSEHPGQWEVKEVPSGIGRKDLPGYADDNGTPNIYPSGSLVYMAEPYGIGAGEYFFTTGFGTSLSNSTYVIPSPSASGTSFISGYGATVIFKFVAPVSGVYYIGSEGGKYNLGTFDLFYHNDWISFDYLIVPSKKYEYSCTVNKGDTVYFYYTHRASQYNRYAYRYSLTSIPIFVDLLADSSITTTNNITINNNTWNGNIYTDNSTNLTYIYPQYTTINEKNETVTNISNTPIIYNNETKQYYTYDQTTKNYYYITYNSDPAPSPTPTPAPTEKPGGSISTPETGKPGGSSGSSWWDKLLSKIGDAIIDGLLGAVSAVLKLIFKLLSTILSWIIWAVSRVFDLLPFLPPGLGGLLVGGVVVCFVIGIIKFIRG